MSGETDVSNRVSYPDVKADKSVITFPSNRGRDCQRYLAFLLHFLVQKAVLHIALRNGIKDLEKCYPQEYDG